MENVVFGIVLERATVSNRNHLDRSAVGGRKGFALNEFHRAGRIFGDRMLPEASFIGFVGHCHNLLNVCVA